MDNDIQSNMLPSALVSDVRSIIDRGRRQAYSAVSSAMVETYWHIGRRIVEEEQQGEHRAEYGTQLIKQLSAALTHEYGKGFSARYLAYFRKFYLTVPDIKILQTRLQNLHWSHIHRILSVDDEVVLSKQLLRSGTSIGANVKEAIRAQSEADFAAKMTISLKEASESEYWLELLTESDYITQTQSESILGDCRELIKILMSITKTVYKK